MQSLERAIKVLKFVAYSQEPVSLTTLARAVQLSPSTTHRIVAVLLESRLLSHPASRRLLAPGYELYRMGQSAGLHFTIASIALPFMRELAEVTQDTVFLTIVEGNESVCIERVEGDFPTKVLTLDVGVRRPLGVGAGSQALLAALPDARVQQVIDDPTLRRAEIAPTLTDEAMWEIVRRVREVGYALSYGSIVPGMGALSICECDEDGQPLFAISLSALKSRLEGERLKWLLSLLKDTLRKVAEHHRKMRS